MMVTHAMPGEDVAADIVVIVDSVESGSGSLAVQSTSLRD